LGQVTFATILNTIDFFFNPTLLFCIPLAFFLAYESVKKNKVLLFLVLPLQSIWCVLRGIIEIADDSRSYQRSLYRFHLFVELHKIWYGLETILLSGLVISFCWVLLKRYGELKNQIVQKELENEMERRQLIEEQKTELEKKVEQRTSELKQSLQELKSTQAQLVQQEKMASLGELTAGIAHEIQNPLNFVNNFSEVNNELIEELRIKNEKLKIVDSEVGELLSDIYVNNDKISMHGKRADAIVKGMLQHSRSSSGQKEPTDINALCDEYLRLSYHGLRAKDKSFNAKFETDLDPSIGKINIVPQDIGRVLLNLINNAFYAVNEKQETANEKFDPCVSLQTKKLNDRIEIIVRDNGSGIPQNIIDKIFQPFFTTKPTGQGTGLGLSLAYDIVKAHGGEIKVETKVDEGNPDNFGKSEGSEFIVLLPA
ncbi:MAG TPA: ATP-binding protein, partial [Chitinophagaceae bacterium]